MHALRPDIIREQIAINFGQVRDMLRRIGRGHRGQCRQVGMDDLPAVGHGRAAPVVSKGHNG